MQTTDFGIDYVPELYDLCVFCVIIFYPLLEIMVCTFPFLT